MQARRIDWTNTLFLCLSPLLGIVGTLLYALRYGVTWWEPVLCLTLCMLIGISIGSGYHRYYSHKAYDCHPIVEAFMLTFGAMALQNSVLQWARDHRDHHKFVDTDDDPYNIKRGFWWAHIVWVFFKADPRKNFDNVPDLTRNRLVMLQHRLRIVLGIGVGLGLPTLVGALFGSPLGGLLWGGFLRIVLIHHTTFFVNSAAHLWGSRPYTEENSARDNWFLAFFTHGEGYHNYHHKFPSDFRNGIRWYHWDPNKWFIRVIERLGLAQGLKTTPPPLIEKARLAVALAKAERRRREPAPVELREAVRLRVEAARRSLDEALELWNETRLRRQELKKLRRTEAIAEFKAELRAKAREYEERFRQAREEWRAAVAMLSAVPQPA